MSEISLSISFGGTNIALGLVSRKERKLLASAGPLQWQSDRRWDAERGFESLVRLIVDECVALSDGLTTRAEIVGVAWPGPGHYAEGRLSATFIPGCTNRSDVRSALREALVSAGWTCPCISFGLDVNARAWGEICLQQGRFFERLRDGQATGIVLNVATGIAGAIVRDGSVLREYGPAGENYGQWGRFLFKNTNTGSWSWRSSTDGSIGYHDPACEVRLTKLCGGPAIFHRFVKRVAEDMSFRVGTESVLGGDFLSENVDMSPRSRDTRRERETLARITQAAADGNEAARGFVSEIAHDLAGALLCLATNIGGEFSRHMVLTGGVGSHFGGGTPEDLLLNEMRALVRTSGLDATIVRSRVGLDAELLGCAFL